MSVHPAGPLTTVSLRFLTRRLQLVRYHQDPNSPGPNSQGPDTSHRPQLPRLQPHRTNHPVPTNPRYLPSRRHRRVNPRHLDQHANHCLLGHARIPRHPRRRAGHGRQYSLFSRPSLSSQEHVAPCSSRWRSRPWMRQTTFWHSWTTARTARQLEAPAA